MVGFSIGNLVLNLFLAVGFKFIWNMVTLLQFLVFMRTWLINLPKMADSFLEALKSLAFFEFLPMKAINDAVLDFLGFEKEENDEFENGVEKESFFD